jgi:hypothetical protein
MRKVHRLSKHKLLLEWSRVGEIRKGRIVILFYRWFVMLQMVCIFVYENNKYVRN